MAVRPWLARLLIGFVTVWNLQAAVVFIVSPQAFVHAYELSGIAGEAAVRGIGILFLMWNVPYIFAMLNPNQYRLGLIFALWMQWIGLFGESYMLLTLPVGHTVLHASILRFIAFDFTGLIFLITAFVLLKKNTAV